MSLMWGAMLGQIGPNAIKTYGDMLQLKEATQQWQDQQAERAASQNAGGNPTDVNGASGQGSDQIIQGIQGSNPTQDAEATMQGLIGVKTAQNPQAAQTAYDTARQQTTDTNNANAQPINVPAPAQPTATPAQVTQNAGIGSGPQYTAPAAPPPGQMTPPTPAGSISAAIGGQEGNKDNEATSVNGAKGPYQITAGTFHAFAHPGEDINNPTDNRAVGNRIIQKYAQDYNNDPKKVAVAYFSGPGNVNNDPNATTPYKHDYADGNGTHVSQYVQGVMRRLGYANKVNSFGGADTTSSAGSAGGADAGAATPAITPDTKLTLLQAKPLPQGVGSAGQTTFTQGPNGIQMNNTVTAAQRAMAAANEAYRRGDTKNAGSLMQNAMTLQTQEAQTRVNAIVNNPNMSQDEKVAALGQLSGSKVYKTENGSYIVPGLGPNDENGNPAPMNYGQVTSMATWMTSPEGMHYAMDYSIQNREANARLMQARTGQAAQATNQANVQSEMGLREKEGEYYGSFKTAQASNQNAQAQERQEQANIFQQKQALGQQLVKLAADYQAGKITQQQYQLGRQTISDQADYLDNRLTNMNGRQGNTAPEKVEAGQLYRQPDGSVKMLNGTTGTYMDPQVSQMFDQNTAVIRQDARFLGYQVDKNSGMVVLPPDQAMKAGLNPKALYATPQAAYTAMVTSPKYRASTEAGGIGGGITVPMQNDSAPPMNGMQ